ncbi:MAG TPA: CSLREA domain-containing protein, partial [Actinomycetota bacterium]|nr:CSLREA domain-containing protein [Actinomycetota bacterium]
MGSRARLTVALAAAVTVIGVVAPAGANASAARGAPAAPRAPATGVTFTVDTTQDAGDGTPDGLCQQLVGCSLREAIQEANATPAKDTIAFAISSNDTTIKPTSPLPAITAPLLVDGSTQPGYRGIPVVEIDGENSGTGDGLTITGGKTNIKAITVNRFEGDGIAIEDGDANIVRSSAIGTDPRGRAALGNEDGISIFNSSNNMIGDDGTHSGARFDLGNVISGNNGAGVRVTGDGAGNFIGENRIGTDAAGLAAIGNVDGVFVQASDTVVGATTAGNLISGNSRDGVHLESGSGLRADRVQVHGNLIGTDDSGEGALGNAGDGVAILGGSKHADVFEDTIAFNGGDAVEIPAGSANSVRQTQLHDNGGLGIDLGPDGVTPNDPGDGDAGANGLLNFPVITSAAPSASAGEVQGTLDTKPNLQFEVELFVSPKCDPSGNGEGAIVFGIGSVTTDGSGHGTFDVTSGKLLGGNAVTATAVPVSGGVSELSGCFTVPFAHTFVVNTTADTGDATPDGVCNDGTNHCSLREAIQEANAATGEDLISFAIPGGGAHTLTPASALPAITERADLDATTQSGFAGTPLVEINGQNAGAGTDGLLVQAGPTRILGFAINRFSGDGIEIAQGSSNVVQRNFLGTDPTGTIDRGNGGNGIRVVSAINTVGGSGAGNVISGNGDSGVLLAGAIETVQGNLIGTDLTGTQALGNGENGVRVDGHLEHIGDIGALGNVISANALDGVLLNSNVNTVQGNRIGTSAAGTADLGNGLDGVHLAGTGIANQIQDNVIGGNTLAGVDIAQTPDTGTPNTVQGNLIGIGSNGSTAIPNQVGVKVANTANVLVGGVQPSKANVVSGNGLTGIQVISSSNASIQGNLVGLDAAGATAVPNSLIGVDLSGAVLVTVGGTGPGEGNVISGNGQEGLRALNNSQDDTILGNLIGTDVTGFVDRGNAFHGVDISDAQDIDVGPGNVISGNNVNGLEIHGSSATGARVVGNLIGEGLGGGALANSSDGVQIFGGASGDVVGGAAAGEGNRIAGNGDDGVQLSSDGNQVLGNAIGVSAHRAGTPFAGVGNAGNGIEIQANGNTIGGLAQGQGNTIEVNSGAGVFVVAGTGNIVRGNSIADNVGLGIDLSPAGVTENDGDDSDTGANLKQNFPTLSGALSSGVGSSIQGSFQGAPNADLDVDFYASPTCDSSGNGEGQRRIGTIGVLANGSGFASFVASLDPIDPGALVTATATDQNGNTSEFSDCIRSVSAGGAAVSGDFDGDGFDDLAIGVPGETPTLSFATGAGAVVVVPGSPSGLDGAASVILTQGSNGVKDTPEAGDGFGSALAAGDFNGDGRDDLAVGVPGEEVGSVVAAGAVNVIYGTATGLGTGGKNQMFMQDTPGVVNEAEAGDRFGSSLAAANLGKTSQADLAVGVPGEGVGTAAGAGGVNVLYGSATGLATTGNRFWSQNTRGIAETAEAGDAFGFAVAA